MLNPKEVLALGAASSVSEKTQLTQSDLAFNAGLDQIFQAQKNLPAKGGFFDSLIGSRDRGVYRTFEVEEVDLGQVVFGKYVQEIDQLLLRGVH
jgi:hypothetical protein